MASEIVSKFLKKILSQAKDAQRVVIFYNFEEENPFELYGVVLDKDKTDRILSKEQAQTLLAFLMEHPLFNDGLELSDGKILSYIFERIEKEAA